MSLRIGRTGKPMGTVPKWNKLEKIGLISRWL